MKKIFLSLAILISAAFYVNAQDMRIQQGQSPSIGMSAGSTATTADWQIGTGAVTSSTATFSHTWSEPAAFYTLHVTPLIGTCSGATVDYSIEVFTTLLPTDPNITALALSNACSGGTSTATLTLANFPVASAYTVSYKVGAAGAEQTATVAAGASTFSIDASALAAGSTTVVSITKFKISGQPTIVFSGPTANLNVNVVPTVTGIE